MWTELLSNCSSMRRKIDLDQVWWDSNYYRHLIYVSGQKVTILCSPETNNSSLHCQVQSRSIHSTTFSIMKCSNCSPLLSHSLTTRHPSKYFITHSVDRQGKLASMAVGVSKIRGSKKSRSQQILKERILRSYLQHFAPISRK